MSRHINELVRWAHSAWLGATVYDYALLMALVVLVGYCISKVTSYSAK